MPPVIVVTDWLYKENAEVLASRIRQYWREHGYPLIRAWSQHDGTHHTGTVWGVRSNIGRDGFPPRR